jgi:3-oxoadipate enol-lactonase
MSTMRYLHAGDGCKIAYRLDGPNDLPVLVLSNSIATNLHMWDGQVDELCRSFRVLRYDTRGHGASDAPSGPYSLDRLGRDVVELLDALEIERVSFCGLSLGGFVGQWLGVHAPERLDRLVLSNTSPYLGPPPQWDELIKTVLLSQDMTPFADMFMADWFPPAMFARSGDVVDAFREMVLATSAQGLAGCFAVVRDTDLRRTNSLIHAPTLVIGGVDDTVTLASHSETIAQTIPGAALVLLPGVHMLNVERPIEFLAAITDFLTKPADGETRLPSISPAPAS